MATTDLYKFSTKFYIRQTYNNALSDNIFMKCIVVWQERDCGDIAPPGFILTKVTIAQTTKDYHGNKSVRLQYSR